MVVNRPPGALDAILAFLGGKGKDQSEERVDGKSPSSLKKAVAFALNAHYTEGLLGENKREKVPSEEIAPGSDIRGIYPTSLR